MGEYTIFMTDVYDDLELNSSITEGSVIKPIENKYRLGINIDRDRGGGRNFMLDPYFKVFIGQDSEHAVKLARISIFRPEYIIHYKDSHNKWFFNNKEKKNFIELLKSTINKDTRTTVWDDILLECVSVYKDEIIKLEIDKNKFLITKMPDYMKLEKK